MLLRCAVPAGLQRTSLSRGLQHSSALVRYATLSALCNVLRAVHAVLEDTDRGAAAASQQPLPAWQRAQWAALPATLRHALRAALPDPQPVVALLAAMEKDGLASGASASLPANLPSSQLAWSTG